MNELTTINEITVHSLKNLRDEIDSCEYGKCIFRGQSSADWPLETSVFRFQQRLSTIRYGKKALQGKEKLAWRNSMWKLEFEMFKSYDYNHSPDEELTQENDLLKVLTKLQHYGCPTRLLDFTWLPLSALFFAASEQEGNFAIFSIDTNDIEEVTHCSNSIVHKFWGEEGAEQPQIFLYRPKYTNNRMKIQKGVFLLPSTTVLPLEKIIASSSLPVKKIIIPGQLRADVIAWLVQMNTGPESVYPEKEGAIRALAWDIAAKLFS